MQVELFCWVGRWRWRLGGMGLGKSVKVEERGSGDTDQVLSTIKCQLFAWTMPVAVHEVRVTREARILSAKKKKKKIPKTLSSEDCSQALTYQSEKWGYIDQKSILWGKVPTSKSSHSFYTILHKNQPHKACIHVLTFPFIRIQSFLITSIKN